MNALTITRSLSLAGLLFAFGPALAETTAVAEQPPESTVLCTRDRTEQLRALSPEDQGSALRDEIRNFQELAEETLSTRAAAIDLYHELRGKLDKNKPLSGDDLMRLNHGATAMLAQREALLRISKKHECWLDFSIPADTARAQMQATGIAMSLSAALLLYDNYLSAVSLYRSDSSLRRHLNRDDKSFELREGQLNKIALSFASPNNRFRVRRGIQWFEDHGYGEIAATDNDYRYLVELIEQSPARNAVRTVRPIGFVGNMTGFLAATGLDTVPILVT